MNNRIVLVFVTTAFLLCLALPVSDSQAGSIWAKRDKNMRDLYVDDVAHQIGDVLTITIDETTKVAAKIERDLEKKTKRSADFDGKVGIDHIIPNIPAVKLGAGTEFSNTLEGSAELKDDRTFTDSITVVVVDILPNGNLVVMGTRKRNIAGDIQIIEASGIVRPSDIAFDNTVKSERVAEFNIVSRGAGISESYNKPGWLGSIFDIIWLF